MSSIRADAVALFLAHLDENGRAAYAFQADLGATLAAHLAAARAAWPDLAVPDERFLGHLAERSVPSRAGSLAALPAPDLYLACACLDADPRACAAFEALHFGEARAAVRRIGAERLFDDVAQSLRQQLFCGPRSALANYAGTGALRGWFRSLVVRTALRLARADGRTLLFEQAFFEDLAASDDPEIAHFKHTYGDAFNAALAEAVASLGARQRRLLREHYVECLSVDELGARYGVHRATAARWAAQARQELVRATRDALKRSTGLTDSAIESLVRIVISQLEISLGPAD